MVPVVQSAVLAELTAIWLAGHFALEGETEVLRNKLLDGHMKLIRDLMNSKDLL
jgi:hypothetical protein